MNSIFHRISVRSFTDQVVEKEKIIKIIQAGMQTPSAGNQQPWEFYVVEDESIIQQLATISPYAGCVVHAKTVIVSVYRKEIKFPEFTQIDLSIAQENMWLETDALGLGGVWLGVTPIQTIEIGIAYLDDLTPAAKCFLPVLKEMVDVL